MSSDVKPDTLNFEPNLLIPNGRIWQPFLQVISIVWSTMKLGSGSDPRRTSQRADCVSQCRGIQRIGADCSGKSFPETTLRL